MPARRLMTSIPSVIRLIRRAGVPVRAVTTANTRYLNRGLARLRPFIAMRSISIPPTAMSTVTAETNLSESARTEPNVRQTECRLKAVRVPARSPVIRSQEWCTNPTMSSKAISRVPISIWSPVICPLISRRRKADVRCSLMRMARRSCRLIRLICCSNGIARTLSRSVNWRVMK